MATIIDLSRSAEIDYPTKDGDTFATQPVYFSIDGVSEDFSTSDLKMEIRKGERLIKTLTNIAGIAVQDNSLSYYISAEDMIDFKVGLYSYEVKKTTSGVVVTIQHGNISVKP